MKILFLSKDVSNFASGRGGFYEDFLKELSHSGHELTVLAPQNPGDYIGDRKEDNIRCIRVKLGSFRGAIPFWRKCFNILLMSFRYKQAFEKFLAKESFDIVMLATPPVTLDNVVKLVKKTSGAKFYLILRDIHPECLVRNKASKEVLARTYIYEECKRGYKANYFMRLYLYKHAQSLYRQADWVGCMSPANITFFKSIAPYVSEDKIVLLPNWYKGTEYNESLDCTLLRKKYNLENMVVAIFGGTIGNAQAVWNIAMLARHFRNDKRVVFVVAGRGSHKKVLEHMAAIDNLTNIRFVNYMPREEYEQLLATADIGIISIDEKYMVPTCPSKIIGYMALAKPVIAMFNAGNDYGSFYIDKAGCGLWSVGQDNEKMFDNFSKLLESQELRSKLGRNGYEYYKRNLTVESICHQLNEQIEYKL